jgi:hypothetical protein
MGSLEQHLLNVNVVLISAGAWFILWVLRKIWKGMDKNKWVSRFKPLYPAVLCQGFVWIPGALPPEPEPTIGGRILMGLWCGFLASIGYQLIKRFLGQRGIELPDKPEELLPQTDKEDDKQEDDADDDDEPEASESRDTPVETPTPRAAEDEGEAGDGDGDDDGKKDGDAA